MDRFASLRSLAKPHLTSSPVTEKLPRHSFSLARLIPRPPNGLLRHVRSSSFCRRPHLVLNGGFGVKKRLVQPNSTTNSLIQQHHLLLPRLPSQLLLPLLLPPRSPPTPRAANLAPRTGTVFPLTTKKRMRARILMASSNLCTRVARLNSSVP